MRSAQVDLDMAYCLYVTVRKDATDFFIDIVSNKKVDSSDTTSIPEYSLGFRVRFENLSSRDKMINFEVEVKVDVKGQIWFFGVCCQELTVKYIMKMIDSFPRLILDKC